MQKQMVEELVEMRNAIDITIKTLQLLSYAGVPIEEPVAKPNGTAGHKFRDHVMDVLHQAVKPLLVSEIRDQLLARGVVMHNDPGIASTVVRNCLERAHASVVKTKRDRSIFFSAKSRKS